MIGIFVGIVIVVVITFFMAREWKAKDIGVSDKVAQVFLGIAVALFAAVLTDALVFCVFKFAATTTTEATEKVASVELVALQDNSSVSGQFFLGSGSVNNKAYYAFYYETPNGYKYDTLDAKSSSHPVYIKYSSFETESPRIDRYAIVRRTVYSATVDPIWFSLFAKLNYNNIKIGEIISERTLPPAISSEEGYYDNFRYEIFVPEGSIQQNYTIDLE